MREKSERTSRNKFVKRPTIIPGIGPNNAAIVAVHIESKKKGKLSAALISLNNPFKTIAAAIERRISQKGFFLNIAKKTLVFNLSLKYYSKSENTSEQ